VDDVVAGLHLERGGPRCAGGSQAPTAAQRRLDHPVAHRLTQTGTVARPPHANAIIVDLGALEFIDSTGIRLLLMAADRCSESGRLSILRGPRQVHRVFEITDLVDRLPFADL